MTHTPKFPYTPVTPEQRAEAIGTLINMRCEHTPSGYLVTVYTDATEDDFSKLLASGPDSITYDLVYDDLRRAICFLHHKEDELLVFARHFCAYMESQARVELSETF